MLMGLEGDGVEIMETRSRLLRGRTFLHPLHEAIHHALLAGLVELDGELVAVDRGDVAVAELDVEHAVADREGGNRAGRARDQLALDGERGGAWPRALRRAGARLASVHAGSRSAGRRALVRGGGILREIL